MDKVLQSQLSKLRNPNSPLSPDGNFVVEAREKIISEIKLNLPEKEERKPFQQFMRAWELFAPKKVALMARPALTLFLVALMSVSGWIATVSASYNSLPGDVLYGVKLAKEKTEISMAGLVGANEKKVELLGNAAKTRAYETKALIEKNQLEKVNETLDSLQNTMNEAKESINDVGDNHPENIKDVAVQLANTTGEIVNTLDEALANVSADTTTNSESAGIVNQIVGTQKMAAVKSMEAIGVVVEKQQSGEINLSDSDVQNMVITAIDQVTTDSGAANVMAEKVGSTDSMMTVSTTTLEVNSSTPVSTTTAILQSLGSVVQCSENCTTSTIEGQVSVSDTVNKANDAIKVEMDSAKQMAVNGQPLEALEKAKQVNMVSLDIKEAMVKAMTVLPVAPAEVASTTIVATTTTSTATSTVSDKPAVVSSTDVKKE
jgi:hypothetical protein